MTSVRSQLHLFLALVTILTIVTGNVAALAADGCQEVFSLAPNLAHKLATADIVSFEKAHLDGKTEHYLVTLATGERAIFKPAPEYWGRGSTRDVWARKANPDAEVFAYEIDRLLDLGMVPPTVIRTIRGMRGSLQLWVESDASEPTEEQLAKLSAFDYLLNNIDRSGADFIVTNHSRNILVKRGHLIAIDNALSLQPLQDFQSYSFNDPVRGLELEPLRGNFEDGLRKLTRERLQKIIPDPSYDQVIREILVRRNKLRARLGELLQARHTP